MPTDGSMHRTVILFASIAVALSGGTNYVYSAYAPQLGHKLGLNHAQLNVIGFGGNAGNYIAGPFWGRAVDVRGPRLLLISAFGCCLVGYLTVRMFYDGTYSLPTDTATLLTPAVVTLTIFQFLTGCGGNASITAALNSTARSFPDRSRATVTGLVISGFGLSAFLFSTIAHVAFPGNTSDFLLLLALGTSVTPLIGSFFLRGLPQQAEHTHNVHGEGIEATISSWDSPLGRDVDEVSGMDDEEPGTQHSVPDAEVPLLSRLSPTLTPKRTMSGRRESLPLSPPKHIGRTVSEDLRRVSESLLHGRRTSGSSQAGHPRSTSVSDLHGIALVKNGQFWLVFSILLFLSGTGLMYINNVGSITQALFISDNYGEWDEHKGSQLQATQVSLTSLGNCFGRAIVGLSADMAHHRWGTPRVYFATLVSVGFLCSQLILMSVDHVSQLWLASATVGLSYGGAFGLLPTITIEWFGLRHFSQNWGFVSLAPVIAGNIFSLAFGKNLDAHASNPSSTESPGDTTSYSFLRRGGLPSELLCYQGRACYVDSLRMTCTACILAIGLSLYAGWLDRRKTLRRGLERPASQWTGEETTEG